MKTKIKSKYEQKGLHRGNEDQNLIRILAKGSSSDNKKVKV
ncbi:hypothetical protein ACQKMN_05685 [Ureibacillus composti]